MTWTKCAALTILLAGVCVLSAAARSENTRRSTDRSAAPPDSATMVRRAIALLRADDIQEQVEVSLYRHTQYKTVIELRVPGGGLGGHFVVTTIPGKVCIEIYE